MTDSDVGILLYALGRVAAVGETETSTGRTVRTVYFLSLGGGVGDVGPVDFAGSDSIREAAKGVKQLRKPVPPGRGLFG